MDYQVKNEKELSICQAVVASIPKDITDMIEITKYYFDTCRLTTNRFYKDELRLSNIKVTEVNTQSYLTYEKNQEGIIIEKTLYQINICGQIQITLDDNPKTVHIEFVLYDRNKPNLKVNF